MAKATKTKKNAKKSSPASEPQKTRDSLREQMEGDYPEAFMFEEAGTMIVGKVVGFSKGYSEYGPHLVVTIRDEEDGEVKSVHCFHTALKNQMLEANPRPGERIAIKYVGDLVAKQGKGRGKTYKNFRVRVESSTRSAAEVVDTFARDDARRALQEVDEDERNDERDEDIDDLPF